MNEFKFCVFAIVIVAAATAVMTIYEPMMIVKAKYNRIATEKTPTDVGNDETAQSTDRRYRPNYLNRSLHLELNCT